METLIWWEVNSAICCMCDSSLGLLASKLYGGGYNLPQGTVVKTYFNKALCKQ